MAKTIEQITPTSWSVTEDIGPITTTYMVYDDDPNVDKFTTDLRKLSVSDINSIKESLDISRGLEGPAGATGATGENGKNGRDGADGIPGFSFEVDRGILIISDGTSTWTLRAV